MASRKFKIKDELPFVAHVVFLFSTVLENNGVMYSKFGGKVMSYLEIYSQIINQENKMYFQTRSQSNFLSLSLNSFSR